VSEQRSRLEALLEAASLRLPNVVIKRLFGCQALYRTSAVFALVWKTGRIGVKLPLLARYQELMSLPGAEVWKAHAVMSHWVLVPESFHSDLGSLIKWLKIAHGLAGKAGAAPPKKAAARPKPSGAASPKPKVKAKKAKPRVSASRPAKKSPR
jgi:hypothetical protein